MHNISKSWWETKRKIILFDLDRCNMIPWKCFYSSQIERGFSINELRRHSSSVEVILIVNSSRRLALVSKERWRRMAILDCVCVKHMKWKPKITKSMEKCELWVCVMKEDVNFNSKSKSVYVILRTVSSKAWTKAKNKMIPKNTAQIIKEVSILMII